VYQSVAYNGTVTIADPPSSFFDIQALFLYIILAAAFAGAGYLVYSTYPLLTPRNTPTIAFG
jgi:hypothetical protein